MLKKNDILIVTVTDINNLGCGIAHVDGMAIFIAGAVTADELEIKIIKLAKSYAVGKIQSIITSSPYRGINDGCTVSSRCGGCTYRHITREYELEIKRNIVISALRRAGLTDIRVGETVSDGRVDGYRNKAQYPVALDADGELQIGFYAQRSHGVVDIETCPLLPDCFSEIIAVFRRFIKEYNIPVYDEKSGRGLLRHIYLRRGEVSQEIMVCPVINGATLPHAEALVTELTTKVPSIVSVMLNINRENTNVILGDEYRCLFGKEYIEDTLAGVRLRLSPDAFYQVNHGTAELLYALASKAAAVGKDDVLLDLYCGAGSIGLSMARGARALLGVDITPSAIENARQNAAQNGIINARFIAADAGDADTLFPAIKREMGADFHADVVILDPPRRGSTPQLLCAIAAHSPDRIVYISCNPDTLARDLVILAEYGYKAEEVTPVDMFPRTGHVECVVLMSRVKG